MSNPAQEFLREKTALNLSGLRQGAATVAQSPFAQAAGAGALTAAGAASFAALVGASKKLYDAATKARDFSRMMEANADLRAHHEADPAGFNRLFTSLRTFAPDATRDPLVAGSYMRRGMESPVESRGNTAVSAMSDMGRVQTKMGPLSEAAMTGYYRGLSMPPTHPRD